MARCRVKDGKYPSIEERLVQYIDDRAKLYQQDKCGLYWQILQEKATEFAAEQMPGQPFPASPGWLDGVLKRHGIIGVSLHGEANDIDANTASSLMTQFRNTLHALCAANGFIGEDGAYDYSRIYNADQTGLFYQKLPNRIYCRKEDRKSLSGVKQMKDKSRVTVMLCASAKNKVSLPIGGHLAGGGLARLDEASR